MIIFLRIIITSNQYFHRYNPYFSDESVLFLHPRSSLCLDRIFPSHGTPRSSFFAPPVSLFLYDQYLTFGPFFQVRRRNKLVLLRHSEVVVMVVVLTAVVVVSPQSTKDPKRTRVVAERDRYHDTHWRGRKCHIRPFAGNE